MTGFYLITGFLGAGKTTFLKEFVRLFPGQGIGVLVNEFGKEDVDSVLLSEFQARMEEVHSGSIFCACRVEQFADALTRLLERSPDVILAETSGLSDPTQIRQILADHPLADRIDYRGCICLIDACHFEKVYAAALACRKQLAVADAAVINKSDLTSPERLEELRTFIEEQRPGAPVLETAHGCIPEDWRETLRRPALLEAAPGIHTRDLSVASAVLCCPMGISREELEELLAGISKAAHRIKGFVRMADGRLYLVQAVETTIVLSPADACPPAKEGRLVVLAGQGQPLHKTLTALGSRLRELGITVE